MNAAPMGGCLLAVDGQGYAVGVGVMTDGSATLASSLEMAVHTYGPILTRFAASLVRRTAEAEDIVQDVFRHMLERETAGRVPPSHVSLHAYLMTAVRRRALNALERRQVEDRYVLAQEHLLASDADYAAAPDVTDAFIVHDEERARVARVRVALAQLPERQRMAVRLRYEQGRRMAEVAATLNVSVSGAEQTVARAIQTLRAIAAE